MEDCRLNDSIDLDQSNYQSRKGALVWFFRKSRDQWKAKYTVVKSEVSKLRKKASYLSKARERENAAFAQLRKEMEDLRAQNENLRAQIQETNTAKKNYPPR